MCNDKSYIALVRYKFLTIIVISETGGISKLVMNRYQKYDIFWQICTILNLIFLFVTSYLLGMIHIPEVTATVEDIVGRKKKVVTNCPEEESEDKYLHISIALDVFTRTEFSSRPSNCGDGYWSTGSGYTKFWKWSYLLNLVNNRFELKSQITRILEICV